MYNCLAEDELLALKHVEDVINYGTGLEKVHFVRLYCIIILQCTVHKNVKMLTLLHVLHITWLQPYHKTLKSTSLYMHYIGTTRHTDICVSMFNL